MINKTLPGVYVDVIAGERGKAFGTVGVVTMPLELNWGDTVITLEKGEKPFLKLGYNMNDVAIKLVNEVMNYANKIIVYRLNNGVKAKATLSTGITAEAIYGGTRGNDINVVVKAVDGKFVIKTFIDTVEVDSQIVKTVADFKANKFISIVGTGALAEASVKLAGGTNGTVANDAYDKYLTEIEKHEYNIMAYTGADTAIQNKIVTFINRMRDENNVMVQAVMYGSGFDNKAIINNTIGGKTLLYDLTPAEACATMAGIQAQCGINASATYFDKVIGWVDVSERLNQIQMETKTQNGEILFVLKYGKVMVLYDINSLVTYTEINPKDFSKNLIVRTLDQYAKELQFLLDTKAIGKIRNSVEGRNQIKGFIADMTVKNYLDKGYVERFTADDIIVAQSAERDSVVATVGIKVVDTVDKIYITVTSL